VLAEHGEHGFRVWGWELPSGLADPAEDLAAAAAREALKETGWEPEGPELLLRLEASVSKKDLEDLN
jgi:8-oxo-dGTP pyrophosphatase MutT (NUDIX family)